MTPLTQRQNKAKENPSMMNADVQYYSSFSVFFVFIFIVRIILENISFIVS